jgi:hypothetical protein
MSFSQMNILPSEESVYRYAFFTTKKGKSTRRFRTCKFVNLQFGFFSTPICPERIFICSITRIMQLIARLFSFSEKKLLRSDIIVVSLFTALEFEFSSLAITKLLIFNELNKFQSLFYSNFMLIYARDFSLAKL